MLEKRGRSDDQITELILDNCRSTYIDGLTDSLTALETLSLINVGLVSLKNFPKLSNLRKLELSDNRISNGLSNLTGSPKLTHLNLSGNRIKDFEELQPLKHLQNLEVLDLFNNQVTLIENYRDKIFQLVPSLSNLDGFDRDYAEVPTDEDECAEDEDDDEEQDDEEESCEDSDDVSLVYLYNENLEEDEDDWKSVEGDYNNGDDDIDTEDDEEGDEDGEDKAVDSDGEGEDEDGDDEDAEEAENGVEATKKAEAPAEAGSVVPETVATEATEVAETAPTESAASNATANEDDSEAKASESEARGKKRKFEGADSDG